ncbi:MAG: hypothetical protein D6719_08315 [Candidatus Dadabacteria bacterium]|nr:MAG: hypothetical protein D6719_08315 [Candidatus Dadabacteria bacterium]
MDIYRFFHPHHNPRLHSTPLRQQELSELEQAAAELRKALNRAMRRVERAPVAPIMPEHFRDILKAMRFVEASLQTLCDAHPGDGDSELRDLINERSGFSGWETWTSLLREQLATNNNNNGSGNSENRDSNPLLKIAV